MASNPNVNKVVYGGTTLIDLTSDTATPDDVLTGKSFHLANGAGGVGTMIPYPDLTIKGDITPTVSGGSIVKTNLKYALTSDRKIGMIWGDMLVRGLGSGASGNVTMTLGGVTVDAPSSPIIIRGLFSCSYNLNTEALFDALYLEITTSGTVIFHYMVQTNVTYLAIHPVLIRFSDFV